jgi:hypothetical protein
MLTEGWDANRFFPWIAPFCVEQTLGDLEDERGRPHVTQMLVYDFVSGFHRKQVELARLSQKLSNWWRDKNILDADWERYAPPTAPLVPRSETRKYLPDFILKVDDGRGPSDPLNLIVEIKGFYRDPDGVLNDLIEMLSPLVIFNGSSFDLPVLRYRAMVYGVAAPGLSARFAPTGRSAGLRAASHVGINRRPLRFDEDLARPGSGTGCAIHGPMV